MKKLLLSLVALMAAAVSASAQAEPTYTAKGTVGSSSEWDAYGYSTPFSAEDLQVEVYGTDSVIVRSWCGVEGYDLCVTLDESGTPSTVYPIVNGEAKPYYYSGYYFVYSGLESPSDVPFYLSGGYSSFESDAETQTGYFIAYCYVTGSNYYYYVFWEPVDTQISTETIAAPASGDGKTYNLAGQRVGSSYKGIVIKNGKKYIQR